MGLGDLTTLLAIPGGVMQHPDRSRSDEAYETFQYENLPFQATHPDWLGTIGRLRGLETAPAQRCRVLELGCGRGGNLVPLATLLPDSEFVGVDLAVSQIEGARRDVDALGLTNLRFEAMDIAQVPLDWGQFDYIVCHGVYSWVPESVRRRILEISATQLTPHGVAYVSFNALPGWHVRGMLRSMLRRVVPVGPAPDMAQSARGFLSLMRRLTPESGPLAAWLWRELALLDMMSDRYLYFEYLVEHNEAFYLDDFLHDAADAGLQYLGNADLATAVPRQLGEDGRREVMELCGDALVAEQLADYLVVRLFRRAVLCRHDAPTTSELQGDALVRAWLAVEHADDMDVDLGSNVEFTIDGDGDGDATATLDPSVSQAMTWVLGDAGPAGMAIAELTIAVAERLGRTPDDALAAEVLDSALTMVVEGDAAAGFWPRPAASEVPERPVAARFTRWQAHQGRDSVTSVLHAEVSADPLDRVLLRDLDGELDFVGLMAVVTRALAEGRLQIEVDDEPLDDPGQLAELVQMKLDRFVRHGLIVDGSVEMREVAPLHLGAP